MKLVQADIEKVGSLSAHLPGFDSLAEFVANDHDANSAQFNIFNEIAARNLLYLQSELAELSRRQDEFDRMDLLEGDHATSGTARDWREFTNAATVKKSKARKRLRLAKEIRQRLKEYREPVVAI